MNSGAVVDEALGQMAAYEACTPSDKDSGAFPMHHDTPSCSSIMRAATMVSLSKVIANATD